MKENAMTMTTTNQNEQTSEPVDPRVPTYEAESVDQEPEASRAAQDFRETVEGGYGWGV